MNDATPVSLADDQQAVLVERIRHSAEQLRGCIDVDPQRRGGVPVLKGTRFPFRNSSRRSPKVTASPISWRIWNSTKSS